MVVDSIDRWHIRILGTIPSLGQTAGGHQYNFFALNGVWANTFWLCPTVYKDLTRPKEEA